MKEVIKVDQRFCSIYEKCCGIIKTKRVLKRNKEPLILLTNCFISWRKKKNYQRSKS